MEAALQGPTGRTALTSDVITIGRTADNQFVVNDSKVSSHHAEMRSNGQGYSLVDLGSTNGTFVNEERLVSNVPRPLNAGDRVRIGDTIFTYEVSGASQAAPTVFADQAGGSGYTPTVAAGPSAGPPGYNTAYGQGGQSSYTPPQSPYTPPQQQYGQQYGSPPPPQSPYTPPQQQYGQQYGSSPQQSFTPPPPAYQPYTPSSPQQSYAPPGAMPAYTPPPAQKKSSAGLRILLIALAVIVVLAAAGGAIAYYIATRPQPVISVTSDYKVGSTLAGSTSTLFHISGHKFSGNSDITFLLDGAPVPGNRKAHSDADGNVKADLTVTDGWRVGQHTLTAKDASDYATKVGVPIMVVPQGQAHTPGLNGAPPDDMTFTINTTIQRQDAATSQQLSPFTETLMVTGQPDPSGGTVCRSIDNGQAQTFNGDLGGGVTYQETRTYKCTGTYKSGKLSYTETTTSDTINASTGVSCTANTPYVVEHLEGTFSDHNTISGTYNRDPVNVRCTNGKSFTFYDPEKGTWTGQV